MATITINIPSNITTRVINGVCNFNGYQPVLPDGTDNPESKAEFAKRMVIEYVKHCVKQTETDSDVQAARTARIQEVDTDIVLS